MSEEISILEASQGSTEPRPTGVVDGAEIGFARDRVERGAKEAIKSARELSERDGVEIR